MTGEVVNTSTEVPIDGGRDVTLKPGQPWPSTFRGSKYSLVDSRKRDRDRIVRWEYRGLSAHCYPPKGLEDAMKSAGKSLGTGKGSFRVTAGGEVLTKVLAEQYPHRSAAPHANGWIPVYLGLLRDDVGFDKLNNDPEPPQTVSIWDGLPFSHGETWAVAGGRKLIWKRGGFRFESAFDHPEIVELYNDYRKICDQLYLTEFGHVWANAPADKIPENRRTQVLDLFERWQESAKASGNDAGLRLVTQRLKAMSPDGDSRNGHMPLHLGHLSQFDDGLIPRPVVTDSTYFAACSKSDSKAVWT